MYDNDFTGFKFNGIHFTIFPYPGEPNTIKLTRVSDGDRYTKELLPQSQDVTVNVPGGDGTYYFGTNFTGKTFVINFAFDDLSETDLRTLRQTLAKRNALAPLILDEEPYKYWMVKCVGMPMIKTICFNGDEKLSDSVDMFEENSYPFYKAFEFGQLGDRIYKGEGAVEFVAYSPFARCGSNGTSKWAGDYTTAVPSSGSSLIYAPTKGQWLDTAGLLSNQGQYDGQGQTKLYNPGDMPTDFKAWFQIANAANGGYIKINGVGITLSTFPVTTGDSYLCYDSYTQLLSGCDSNYNETGTLYNRYAAGTFVKIPVCSTSDGVELSTDITNGCRKIEYDYLYY